MLCVGIVALAWLPYARVQTVEVNGAESVGGAALQTLVMKMAEGTRGLVFPKNNVFVFPYKIAEGQLLAAYPVFSEVKVERSGLHTVSVSIVERTATALWCGESQASSSPCYLLDDGAVAYAPAAEFSGQVYVRYYGALDSASRQFISQELFKEVAATVNTLQKTIAGETPVRTEIQPNEVRVVFESGFVLLYSPKGDAAGVLERLSLALQAEPFLNKKLSDFEYLDLRFGDKLYYKLKVRP